MFNTTVSAELRDRYPILPDYFNKISNGNTENLCLILLEGPGSVQYTITIDKIKKYHGDVRDFFYKYVMSLRCKDPAVTFADYLLKKSLLNTAFSVVFKRHDGVDPNTFVIIKREGLIFEGPMHVVFSHLEKHFKHSPEWSSVYRGVSKRLTVKKFVNGTPKSCKELQKENPKMPCVLPMPRGT